MEQTETVAFIIIANVILFVFIIGIILFMLQYRKRKVEHETEKTMINQKHTQELLSTQLEMQTQTMQHIGREIHDSVGQKLTLASLYTQQLAFENKAPQVKDKIENISGIINQSLQELRKLSKTLNDDVIAENDIATLLKEECAKVNALQKCTVHLQHPQAVIKLPYQSKSILLRVAQEFLQNSIKHAGCKNIFITLDATPQQLHVQLQDDGRGFEKNIVAGKGIGLNNMEKRIKLIGGKFNLKSIVQSGTIVQLEIPL